jgi:hypothetical protein
MSETSRDPDQIDESTKHADERDARHPHEADRMPTPDEDAAAPTDVDQGVREHYREMTEKGAHAKGEGRIDEP